MADLWPNIGSLLADSPAEVVEVESLDEEWLEATAASLRSISAIVGLGGGQAIDAAKYAAWKNGQRIFTFPTALTVNAAWGHRSAVRRGGVVRYVGWTVPEAVFVDYGVVRSAPAILNRSGVGDILCYHSALWDWEYASRTGNCEPEWPYRPELAAASRAQLDRVRGAAREIHEVSETGIDALVEGLRYGGGAFAANGWNPRPIEGAEHFVFYALERVTGRAFLHGQAVGLGLLVASVMQGNDPDGIRRTLDEVGVPYQPADLGIDWQDLRQALEALPDVVAEAGLWYTIASARRVTDELFDAFRTWIVDGSGSHWVDPEGWEPV